MKTYQIELKRTSYLNIEVEAESQEEAEAAAWRTVEHNGVSPWDAAWELESIEEMTTC